MSLSTSVAFPRSLVNQILHCAQQQPERETCGLIGAKGGLPASFYAVDNIAEPPESRFGLDPQQQIGAMRAMRERGEDLFAIFHSHPEAAAEPSSLDLELAAYPEALYLIVSLGTQGVLELRGFRLQASGRFAEVPLLLQPST
jgi:proteasome lid subunit RPN8/RPN11